MFRINLHGAFSLLDSSGSEVPLKSKKAKGLLAFLARPIGKSRSREEIMALLWSDRSEAQGRASLRQVLAGLRKNLGPDSANILIAETDFVSLNPDQIAETDASGEFLEGFHINDPAFDDWLRDERAVVEKPAAPNVAGDGQKRFNLSVAVLPFSNLSGDPEQEYFSDGITEDIITELNRHQVLFVIASSSSFKFRGENVDPVEVGQKLGVRYIVSGSVRKAGNRFRISSQLIDTRTSQHLWSEKFDRDLTDIFALQDEIAATVSKVVSGHVDYALGKETVRKHPADIHAYDLVCRSDWYAFRNFNDSESLRLLQQAIELDPNYAHAHSRISINYAYELFSKARRLSEVEDLVNRHADIASRNSANDANVHGQLSETYAIIGDHDKARHHLERATHLNPNSFGVLAFGSEAASMLGEHNRAVTMMERAMDRNPYDMLSLFEIKADVLYLAGQFEATLSQFAGWPDPPFHMRMTQAAALAQLDRDIEAQHVVEAFEQKRPPDWDIGVLVENFLRCYLRDEDKNAYLDGFKKSGLQW